MSRNPYGGGMKRPRRNYVGIIIDGSMRPVLSYLILRGWLYDEAEREGAGRSSWSAGRRWVEQVWMIESIWRLPVFVRLGDFKRRSNCHNARHYTKRKINRHSSGYLGMYFIAAMALC